MSEDEVLSVQRCYPQIYLACHREHVRKQSTRYQLSAHDSAILSHLSQTVPLTPAQLTRHLGVAASTFSPQLARLVDLGYVERTRAAKDKRHWQLTLTKAGAEAMSATSVLDAARVRRVLALLSEAERARAIDGISLLAAAAKRLQTRGER